VFAYERVLDPDSTLVVAPRLTSGLGGTPPVGDVWGDTALAVQNGGVWRCLLSGTDVRVDRGMLRMSELLAVLPVAVLRRTH
jgi:maltooligosyltrehalose synthase